MGCCGDRTEPERVDGKIPGYGENDGFDGPMQKRGCTDVICLLIFLAYLGGMVAVFAMAIAAYGDPYRFFYGYDVKGDTCGRKNDQLDIYPSSGQDLSDKPYLHFDIARTGILFLPQSEFDEFGINVDKNVVGDDKIEYCLTGNATLLAAIFAYMIIDCFVGVYGMAIDTIFLSFCEDSERNDGITKPYYMSVGLMEFVENSSKALAAMKKRQEVAASNNPAYNPELPAPQNNNEMPNVA